MTDDARLGALEAMLAAAPPAAPEGWKRLCDWTRESSPGERGVGLFAEGYETARNRARSLLLAAAPPAPPDDPAAVLRAWEKVRDALAAAPKPEER